MTIYEWWNGLMDATYLVLNCQTINKNEQLSQFEGLKWKLWNINY